MRFFLLSLLILTAWAGEAEPPKLPADVQSAIDKATKGIDAAQAKVDAEILKQRQALIKELTKLQESYTKKGNLDVALAIKTRIDEENTKVENMVMANTPVLKLDNLTEAEWASLKGKEFKVTLSGACSTGINVKEKDKYAFVPHPTDTWGREAMFTYKGNDRQPNWVGTPFNAYALLWIVGETQGVSPTITGIGQLMLKGNLGTSGGSGSIRVKIIQIP
jgi:hypothetical protein